MAHNKVVKAMLDAVTPTGLAASIGWNTKKLGLTAEYPAT